MKVCWYCIFPAANGSTTSMSYDLLGRRTALTDADTIYAASAATPSIGAPAQTIIRRTLRATPTPG